MGWIGVDFDGTLATDGDSAPIAPMVERVKRWLAAGIEVRIVTARVNEPDEKALHQQIWFLSDWCTQVFGRVLPLTCSKDYQMYQLWDDRAVQVIKDTGERVGNHNRPSSKELSSGTLLDEESGYIG